MMQSTACFFVGFTMAACASARYARIRVGAMSEQEEMRAGGNGKAIDGQHDQ